MSLADENFEQFFGVEQIIVEEVFQGDLLWTRGLLFVSARGFSGIFITLL